MEGGIPIPEVEEKNAIDLHKIIGRFLVHWPWFLGCLVAALVIAFLYLRYSTPLYKVNAKILVQDDKKGAGLPDANVLEGLGISGGKSSVDNDLEIIKSRTLMTRVVKGLQLNVSYFTLGRIKEAEVFAERPFDMYFLSFSEDSLRKPVEYFLRQEGTSNYVLEGDGHKWKGRSGDTLRLPIGDAVITRRITVSQDAPQVYVQVTSTKAAVSRYMSSLSATLPNKQVSTIALTLQTAVPDKGEVVLNRLIAEYMQANVDDRNRIADSTMRFIDERLQLVNGELVGIEKSIENFKSSNELTDLSEQSKQLLSNTTDYARQLTEKEVQYSVLQSLERFVNSSGPGSRVVPATLMIQDPAFSSLVNSYNALQLQREQLLMTTTESNPVVRNLDQQMAALQREMNQSIASLKRQLQTSIGELRSRVGAIDAQIRQVPAKERTFLEYSRQQAIKQELYVFLLKKREESALTKSSTVANARIVDAAERDEIPFKPKRQLVYLSAFVLGILVPYGGIALREALNTKIRTKEDITSRTQAPILGEISHNPDATQVLVVTPNSRNAISEQFRALRSNLQFVMTGQEEKTILLTSSMSGEGKSFVSLNLASALAITDKKVVVMELDLRKPKISKYLGLDNNIGFSNYAIGAATAEQIIRPSGVMENLFVISSGPIPPNPAELLSGKRAGELFAYLKEHFDYIVVDVPPVGVVTDAQLLSSYADVTLFLVRQDVTDKAQLSIPEELVQQRKMPKLSLVVNDIKQERQGYGYGYGYGYGDYIDEGQKRSKKTGLGVLKTRFKLK